MPAKTGPKSKLTSADHVRIAQLIEQSRSDSEIASLFGVSRSTILRLRRNLATENPPTRTMSALEQMMAEENARAAKGDEIHEAYHSGDSKLLSQLWDEYLALP